MMEWHKLKAELLTKKEQILSIAGKIKSNEEIDVSIEVVLGAIPIVGPLLSKYWSTIGDNKTQQLEMIAKTLEIMSKQESSFESMRTILDQFGESIQQSNLMLDIVVNLVANVEGDVWEIKPQIERIVDATKNKFVTDALSVAGSLIDDHTRRNELIRIVKGGFDDIGQELTPDRLYNYGRLFMVANHLDLAEACLLELHHQFPERTDALVALSTLYQRRAHEYILQKNFGLAEMVLQKAQSYVKAADDAVEIPVDLQLAYGYKELGQAYRQHGQWDPAAVALRRARQRFGGVLAVEKTNVSALNGMGSVESIEGNFEEGIKYASKAVELEPSYVEAWCDLAHVYLALSRTQIRQVIAHETRKKGVDAYLRVKELIQKGIGLPREAEQCLDKVYSSVPELGTRKREARDGNS